MPYTPEPIEVFFSYADQDEPLRKELEKHLSLLLRQGFITSWHHRLVAPGTDWTRAVDKHLERASIILLLISADFFASNYCYGVEVQRALQRHQAGQARVLPILIRPVNWKCAPFEHLRVLPVDGKPITAWKNQDEAFVNVVAGICQAIEDFAHPNVSLFVSPTTMLKSSAGHAVLGANDVTIGRAPDNTYVINDSRVSGHHAVIRQYGQGYAIFDLKSTNRTFVNGQMLPPETAMVLRQGDSIRVGATTFEYSDNILTTPITAPPTPPPPHTTPALDTLSRTVVIPSSPPRITPSSAFAALPPTDRAIPKFPPRVRDIVSSHSSLSRGRVLLLIGLVMLVTTGLFLFINGNQVTQQNANATATARTLASDQVQANLTGTATVTSRFPPFTALVFHDQLTSSSDSQWAADSACQASSSGYQVSMAQHNTFEFCRQLSSTFDDFAFQVNMTIQSGDCGGLVFREFNEKNYYVVLVCSDGTYDLGRVQNGNPHWASPSLDQRPFSSAIQRGTGLQNIVAVVVQGNTFNLYVNDLTKIINVFTDSATPLGRGSIALVADDFTNPTSVMYTNAVVWTQ